MLGLAACGGEGAGELELTVFAAASMTEALAEIKAANDAARIASAIPGALRSPTARVASGVTSRGENPVVIRVGDEMAVEARQGVRPWQSAVITLSDKGARPRALNAAI